MRVGITFSSFDLLYADDVMMLKESKKQCDYLIVGLQLYPSLDRSNKNAPSKSITERYIQLKDSNYVNEIVPYVSENDVEDIMLSFKIDVYIIGDKHKTIDFTLKEYCTDKRIEIHYNSREYRFSSTEIKTS